MPKRLLRINNYPSYFLQLIWLLFVPIYMRLRGVTCGKNVICHGFPIISTVDNSEIIIGTGVVLCSNSKFTDLGVNHPVILRTLAKDAVLKIGDQTGISGATICASKKITIGSRVLLGANVTIMDTDFHAISASSRYVIPLNELDNKEVLIEDNVFIGANSIILKGSRIGKNSVIGAGSVVAGVIPENAVAAGNPARAIKVLDHKI